MCAKSSRTGTSAAKWLVAHPADSSATSVIHVVAPGARELSTGAPVALTFVDTTGAAPMAPVTPREAATVTAVQRVADAHLTRGLYP